MYRVAEYHYNDGSIFITARKDNRSYKRLVADAHDPTNTSPAYQAIKEGKLSHVTIVEDKLDKSDAFMYANYLTRYYKSKGRRVLNVKVHKI